MSAPRRKLRVCLDLTPLRPSRTGVDRYLITLARGLLDAKAEDLRLTILVNRGNRSEMERMVAGRARITTASPGGRIGRVLAMGFVLPWLTRRRRFDVVHSPSFIMPMLRGGARHMLTVFDMTTHSRPECHTTLRRSPLFRGAVSSSIRRADLIAVPSHYVRRELLRLHPEVHGSRVRCIPLGLDPCFRPDSRGRSTGASTVDRDPFLLFVGTIEPRKNLPGLLDAYRQAMVHHGLRHRLELVGSYGWNGGHVLKAVRSPEFRTRVSLTGYISQEELVKRYRAASLLVYPSIEEGFGYPPLEAMACGTPVIATDTSSLRENLRGAALLVRPDSPADLAAAMAKLVSDPEERRRLRAAGLERARRFTASATARRTLACYRDLNASAVGCCPSR